MAEASRVSGTATHRAVGGRRRPTRPTVPSVTSWLATLFVLALLGLAIGLALWAPWQSESTAANGTGRTAPPAIQSTGERPTAAAPATSAGVAPVPNAAVAPGAVAEMRPEGLPVRRTDWLILRDYQAHGGSGPNGAIAIGLLGNRDAVGTPVYATHDGIVRALRDSRRYGNLVAVKNGRWSTTYGFLDHLLVTDGQVVRRGDQVGTLGQSGTAPGPRLDYQVWEKVNGVETNRNPMEFLASR